MPIGTYNHPIFGLIKFKTKSDTWVRGDPITIIDGFDPGDVTTVMVPQLAKVEGAKGGRLRFHKRGHKQLLAVFNDIEKLGLLRHIKFSAGAYNPRLRKPTNGRLSKEPSNHSFGIAVDLNSEDGCNGCTTAPFARVFQAYKFRWGKSFNDPMHYEVLEFIDKPNAPVTDIGVFLSGNSVKIDVKSIFGSIFVNLDDIGRLPGVTVDKTGDSAVTLSGPLGRRQLRTASFGDIGFVSLPQAAGLAGLKSGYDIETKTVHLEALT